MSVWHRLKAQRRRIYDLLQWYSGGKSERTKTPRHKHLGKPNTEQPCIENTKKLLFAFEFAKKT